MSELRIALGGDRDIAVWVLEYLLEQGVQPKALLVSSPGKASHAQQLIELCSFLDSKYVLSGSAFRASEGRALLEQLDLDYIIGIHFPYIVPDSVLALPRYGVLNLHPAYLPHNRGWHTPSWAILEGTPIGATLHFMDKDIDTGDIVHQKQLLVSPGDTADSLYQKLKQLEFEVFQEALPYILSGTVPRIPQVREAGTTHQRDELFSEVIQKIHLESMVRAGDLIRQLRALTTNEIQEAAYYEVDGIRYRVQVQLQAEES